MMRIVLLGCMMIMMTFVQGQVLIKGVVKDSLDNGLTNVTVLEQKSGRRVMTDQLGKFELITVNDSGNLVFQHVGYRERMKAFDPNARELLIILDAKVSEIEEVIISTGYQHVPKERSTGSFATVSGELFNQQVGTDILSRLPAIANSVVMDAGRSQGAPQMMVRGLSTINGPKSPLIVVDNFPYDGDINNINPNIVENITILKDAAASSIWGARAANGVIVITTKKGTFNKETTIDLNSMLMIGERPDLYYIPQMAASDFVEMEQELYRRGFYRSKLNSASKPLISPVVDLLDLVDQGMVSKEDAFAQMDKWKTIDTRDQFDRYVYKPSFTQQYFLSASGGSPAFSWISSIGYDRDVQSLGGTYQRLNLRFQNTYNITDKLSLTTDLYYTLARNRSGREGYTNVPSLLPYMEIADESGNALAIPRGNRKSFLDSFGDGQLLDWSYYPLTDWKYQSRNNNATDLLGKVELQYEITAGLSAGFNYQYERQGALSSTLADEDSYMARDYINRFTQFKNGGVEYIVPRGAILDKGSQTLIANNIRGRLNYNKEVGRGHIAAIAGIEVRSANRQSYTDRFYGYNANNMTVGNIDYRHTYPNVITGGATYIQNNQSIGETDTRFVSQFANAAYSYDNRYTVSASMRRDASNLFGLKTNEQWNPFWSAGLAWKLSNENFYRSDLIPYLNVRGTYGFSGNVDPSMVAVNTVTYANPSVFTGIPFARYTNFYNPQLKWETSKMMNLAIDFRTKNSRLSGAVEYYRKWGKNLFGQAPIDLTTGINPSMQRNVANMRGHGVDVELTTINIDRPTFQWRTVVNFSLYKDAITSYHLPRTLAQQYVNVAAPPISGIEGKPVYAIYAYKWAGLDPATGEAQGLLNGEISKDYASIVGVGTKEEDLAYFGSAIPTRYGNILNAFSYGAFNLQVGITYKQGYWFRRSSINYTDLFNNGRGHSDYSMRWQNPGDERITSVPANLYSTNNNRDRFYEGSSVLVEKGDHLRLQYIRLAYDLPRLKSWNSLQLYFNMQNVGLLWKANKAGIDPDFSLGRNRLVTPRTWSFGIKIKI
ncbi:SusC/RagA family TonB-linked outer membrane protein [Sphingobacterium gobiense]|uniref:SusC/RagA family TonB-linked outer membrane protein n=1 Tax=Sphingobacterium gobiense TaxID=1382456 RepID=A0A2S9JTU5_9SPHI|nr:SusC/RagA family TonB-linked outer membrane protein [Sphingobacterium gobiense]PRD56706.1 hypothetical protein C5749_05600 [Sphingobacterium gobiense]